MGGIYAVVVAPWARRYQGTSATLQEMLDVDLFQLPWNHVFVGEAVPEDEVSRLSRRFRGDETQLLDYYLIAEADEPLDVAFCLEQNLAWGSRVRRRFANLIVGVALVWCGICVVAGVLGELTFAAVVSAWFVPSLGLFLLCLDIYRSQVSVTAERTRVLGLLRTAMDRPVKPGPEWTAFARQVQDVLFQVRRQQPRVPNRFFRRMHDSDREDFLARMRTLERTAGTATSP